MGLQPSEFEEMTPVEFKYAFEGWLTSREESIILSWEQARFLAYNTLILNLKSSDRKPMKVMFPMAWDNKEETEDIPELTYEERVEKVREFQEFMKRRKLAEKK